MAARMNEFVRHLRTMMLQQDGAGLSDGQLLGRFIEQRDEAAAAALVRRHGPMVWGVCLRLLGNPHDAEDAFQATFLVLVRRAAAISPREMVGNWLYGVAYQTALKARATLAKRRTREKQMESLPEIEVESQQLRCELQDILDQELSRLPDKYRVAIVLCDLEGRTRTEAARHLGVPPGTLASRLTRGRALLAKRLMRHGLAVSSGTLTAALAEQTASAAVMSSTIKAVSSVALGQAAKTGAISAPVAALTEGVVKAMFVSKIKIVTGVLLVLTVSAAGGWLYKTQAGGPAGDAPRVEEKKAEDARMAALKALEKLGKSEQTNDRDAAIEALADYRRELKAAEAARRRHMAAAVQALIDRFSFRVPIEIGVSEFREGGRIEIAEVWGTRPRIEVGGQYLVRGKYALPPGQRGKIYFYTTSEGTKTSNTVEGGETEVKVAQARLNKAKAIAEKHQAAAWRWDSEVNRLKREVERTVVDPQVLHESENQLNMARATLRASEADVQEKKALLAAAEARLAKNKIDSGLAARFFAGGYQNTRGFDLNRWIDGVPTLDLQMQAVDKQKGEFALVHGMTEAGYFHLILTDPERYSRMFANVYFGTGDNVLRKKSR